MDERRDTATHGQLLSKGGDRHERGSNGGGGTAPVRAYGGGAADGGLCRGYVSREGAFLPPLAALHALPVTGGLRSDPVDRDDVRDRLDRCRCAAHGRHLSLLSQGAGRPRPS